MKDEYDFSKGERGKFHRPHARVHLPKTAGERIIASMNEALRYARGEDVPGVRVTTVDVPAIDSDPVQSNAE